MNWPTISAGSRLRTSGWVPVWQKLQVSVQPTWLETQTEPRSSSGLLTVSLSLNDGFYSNNYNWVSGSVSYTLNKSNTIAVSGGGAYREVAKSTFVTPVAQNNSRIINLIYTYNAEPWTITLEV